MIITENWGPPPQEWIDLARSVWQGNAERRLYPAGGKIESFEARCMEAFKERGVEVGLLKVWINTMVPKEEEGYDEGFPHTHESGPSLTIVHCIEPGDKPAPLHILEGDKVIQEIYPESGLTVFIPDGVSHGVLKNNGTTNRTGLIGMAML